MEKKNEGMLKTFLHLKENARACIWTEPLWGIPYQLYAPFVSLFMVGLGLSKSEIGLVALISLAMQVITFTVLNLNMALFVLGALLTVFIWISIKT